MINLNNNDGKFFHLVVCFGISIAITYCGFRLDNLYGGAFIGFFFSMGTGFAKEAYDKNIKQTQVSMSDLKYDLIGALSGSLIMIIIGLML